jgi:glycosyltransferase involved in cell wall biosynthesis
VDVFILGHGALVHALEPYLLARGHRVRLFQHPLDRYDGRPTFLREGGRELWRRPRRDRGRVVNLGVDFAWSARRLLAGGTPDVVIAINNFDTLVGLFARRLRAIRRVIYFASDFSDERFGDPLLDRVYEGVERLALRGADLVVSNTRRAERRRGELGLDPARSLVMPNGVALPEPVFEPKPIDRRRLIFVGSVTREHGLHDLLDALAGRADHLTILGEGPDLERVLALCAARALPVTRRSGLANAEVLRFLQGFSGVGLAPYNRTASWTWYCSPVKVHEYVACGVPVLMSSVPEIAETVRARGLGVVYDTIDGAAIGRALDAFDTGGFHEKARAFYADHNHEALFARLGL